MSNDYNNYGYNNAPQGDVREMFPSLWANEEEFGRGIAACLTKVFLRMFIALLVTALTAYLVASSPSLLMLIYGNTAAPIVLMVAMVGLVIGISAGINKLSPVAANVLFFLYAIVNGLTLSVIFLVYELGVIYQAFTVTALMFGAMALYGAITQRNLMGWGNILFMALIGIILASLVNVFFRSEMFEMIVCYVGVLVFVGLTAYDTQRIKNMLAGAADGNQEMAIQRISVIGALSLYLNFINLFLRILRILGRRN